MVMQRRLPGSLYAKGRFRGAPAICKTTWRAQLPKSMNAVFEQGSE